MKVVLQRVSEARVRVDGAVVGEIGAGLMLLCAFRESDDTKTLEWMAEKCLDLRVFNDDDGLMNRSLREAGGGVLAISQFTLYGNCRKGRRPSFVASAPAEQASQLYDEFMDKLRAAHAPVAGGIFQAKMDVELINDGPVTLILEREAGD
jgi:D-aminoacyl-tRNA deacylase